MHLGKVQPTHIFPSMPLCQTYPCSCHSSSPHIFHSLPTKPKRLRVSWKSDAETGADLRHLIGLLNGGFVCVESFAGEAHHSSCGMDSLSRARVQPARRVCCCRAADLAFPGGHVCTLSCLTSAGPDRGPVSPASLQRVFGILLQQHRRRRMVSQTQLGSPCCPMRTPTANPNWNRHC